MPSLALELVRIIINNKKNNNFLTIFNWYITIHIIDIMLYLGGTQTSSSQPWLGKLRWVMPARIFSDGRQPWRSIHMEFSCFYAKFKWEKTTKKTETKWTCFWKFWLKWMCFIWNKRSLHFCVCLFFSLHFFALQEWIWRENRDLIYIV